MKACLMVLFIAALAGGCSSGRRAVALAQKDSLPPPTQPAAERKPAWSGLLPPGFTNESARAMDTRTLATVCLSSGVLSRLQLAYNKPDDALSAAMRNYPGYAELFTRRDLPSALIANLDAFAAQLRGEDASATSSTMRTALMTIDAMGPLYKTEAMGPHLRGHEKEFIRAQLNALKALREYSRQYHSGHGTALAMFPPEPTAESLWNSTAGFITAINPAEGARIRRELDAAKMQGQVTQEDWDKRLALAIREIEAFSKN